LSRKKDLVPSQKSLELVQTFVEISFQRLFECGQSGSASFQLIPLGREFRKEFRFKLVIERKHPTGGDWSGLLALKGLSQTQKGLIKDLRQAFITGQSHWVSYEDIGLSIRHWSALNEVLLNSGVSFVAVCEFSTLPTNQFSVDLLGVTGEPK
jgi:hypothetical protein